MTRAGYILMDVRIVALACETYLRARDERIRREREALIEEAMRHPRFFGLRRTRTRDEAIKHLKSDDEFGSWSSWDWAAVSGGKWADLAKQEATAARIALPGSRMSVDAELAAVLANHVPEVSE